MPGLLLLLAAWALAAAAPLPYPAAAAAPDLTPAPHRLRRARARALADHYTRRWLARGLPLPQPQPLLLPLDHYSAGGAATSFNSTFWLNTAYLNASAAGPLPLFLFVCAEEECDASRTLGGVHVQLAQAHGAAILALQHRYYGSARPFPDTAAARLGGLASAQALADWAWLLSTRVLPALNASAPGAARVVAFGGSYGGQLAAWLRLKYPHLVHAAVASSAPVLTALDYPGYDDVVGRALGDPASGGAPACRATLAQGFEAIAQGLAGGASARARAAALAALASCTDLTASPLDAPFGITQAANVFKGVVQSSGQWFARYGIAALCANLSASLARGGSPLDAVGDFTRLYLAAEFGPQAACQSLGYGEWLAWISDASPAGPAYRLWLWQTCSEQGKAQSSAAPPGGASPFSALGQSAAQYYEACGEVFGGAVGPSGAARLAAAATARYGGTAPAASRVAWVNGLADPWSEAGVLATADAAAQPLVLIPGASHCADMDEAAPGDSAAMAEAHRRVAGYVAQWLAME